MIILKGILITILYSNPNSNHEMNIGFEECERI